MKTIYSPKALNKAIEGINIPAAEDILPAAAAAKKANEKALITPIILKRYGIAAAAAVLVITLSIPAVIHMRGNTPPTTETGTPYYIDWPVIDNEIEDSNQDEWAASGQGGFQNFGEDSSAEEKVLPQVTIIQTGTIDTDLQEKMYEYKGQEVLFPVYIVFLEYELRTSSFYKPSDTNKKELEGLWDEMIRQEEQIENFRKEYRDKWDETVSKEYWDLIYEHKAVWKQYHELLAADKELFVAQTIEAELKYITEITGQNPEFTYSGAKKIRMDLPADIIEKISERGYSYIHLRASEKQTQIDDGLVMPA